MPPTESQTFFCLKQVSQFSVDMQIFSFQFSSDNSGTDRVFIVSLDTLWSEALSF